MNRVLLASIALGLTGTAAVAQHAGDILLTRVDGRLATGAIDEEGSVIGPERVFVTAFDGNFIDEPGIYSDFGAFTPGTAIGFTVRAALRAWDGSDFDTIPAERISMRLGPLGPITTPLTDVPVVGFNTLVGATGEFHRHYGYTLNAPAGDGVYMLELELWATDATIAPSLPYWILFGQNADASDLAAAAAWVKTNLAGACAADFDADGFLTFNDFDAFVSAFESGETKADFDADGFLTFNDFDAFVEAFERGC
ncbi:MAG: GC-type dockerin domain-anchored protein [Planctomycetota bacterium]|nr:GC-type dockerin domain-anchored protein [Planctomycetota bacterium]